jgi:hypothetical protein
VCGRSFISSSLVTCRLAVECPRSRMYVSRTCLIALVDGLHEALSPTNPRAIVEKGPGRASKPQGRSSDMSDDQVASNLQGMDDLDFTGWNNADWDGVFAHHHTSDVLVDWKGQAPTHGIEEHIDAMKAYVDSAGGTPPQITAHPIAFGSGEWTCVVGEFEGGSRMVTVARWQDGAIAEEYIWA